VVLNGFIHGLRSKQYGYYGYPGSQPQKYAFEPDSELGGK